MATTEEQHVALPKLYGAPAYARPPRSVEDAQRPFDPDDLPLEAFRTEEEHELAPAEGRSGDGDGGYQPRLQPRPFRLRALGRLLGNN